MSVRGYLAAGQIVSAVAGIALLLGLVSAGVTREVPIGRVKGSLKMLENGQALPDAEIVLRPVREAYISNERADEQGLPRYRYARSEDDGSFQIANVTAGKYMIEAYGKAHQMEPIPVEVVEGKGADVHLELRPRDPYLDLYAGQHVFQPNEAIAWDLHGFVKAEQVRIEVFKLRFEDVVKEGTLYNALAPLARRDGTAVDPATLGTKVSERTEQIIGRDVEGTFRLNLKQTPLPEGLYWIRNTVGTISQGTYFSVTNVGLVLKRITNDVVVFAANLETGDAVSGVNVGHVQNGAFISSGTTGRDGLARFKLPALPNPRNLVVIGRKGGSAAFVDFYHDQRGAGQGHIYLYTDRPVYRPGDEVNFKGIVRQRVGSSYQIPAPGPVEIKIVDAEENTISTSTLQSSPNGTFSGRFTPNKEAAPGIFRVEADFGDKLSGQHGVMVAAYRKPNYSIKVRPEKPHYIRGEKVRMIVECEYYFGGPVADAKVQATVFRAPTWDYYDPEEEPSEYEGEEGYGGEWFTDAEAVTDSSGRAIIEFPSRLPDEERESWTDVRFNVTASVADEAGAYFEGKGSVKVSGGEFSLRANSDRYAVEKGQAFEVEFETLDAATDKPAPAKRVEIEVGYEFWDGLVDQWKPFAKQTITTGEDGKKTMVITPAKSGNVVVKAKAVDDSGNEITTESYVWSTSEGAPDYYGSREAEPLSMRLDKKDYEPGDVAKAVIQVDEPGVTAVVSVEADKIYHVRTLKLANKTTTVNIPVKPEYAPNVFVTVCFVKDKQFQSRGRRLVVDLGKRILHTEVTADAARYEPGDTARYTIKTTDESGRPVSAEVSLSVVDEAIYAIREDDTDLVDAFYPMRWNEVDTTHSFQTLYLDGGDKAPPEIEIRRIFKDTAFWDADIQTDAQGVATVQVPLPDNLTTWRATVQAIDRRTAVGEAVSKVVAKKDLMVRLQTPPFYVAGDVQRLAATVTNDSGRDANVNVDLTLGGGQTADAKRQTLTLKNGESKAVEWSVTVPEPGEAVHTARAWIDQRIADGVEAKVPIRPRGRTEKEAITGDVSGTATIKLNVKGNADRTTGGAVISLSPSLAAPLFQSLDDLIGFPYGCVEQTMSRFMPATVVAKVVSDLGLPKPRQAKQIPQIAREGYARLGRMQSYQGSWGWWEGDNGDPFMTAYVLEGIYRARQAGFPEHSIDVDSALKWAEDYLKKVVPAKEKDLEWQWRQEIDARAYLAFSLTLFGRNQPAATYLNAAKLEDFGPQSLAFAAMALHRLGPDHLALRDRVFARMKSLAEITAGTARWEEHYWGIESTARCFQAIAMIEPTSQLVQPIIRYLMLSRRGDMWASTRDTAIGLLAICDYMKAINAKFGDASIGVWLNGKPLGVATFTAQTIAQAPTRVEIPMRLLVRGENTVEIRNSGGSSCFYSAELVQTVVDPSLAAFSNLGGVSIVRSYHRLVQEPMENGRRRLVPSKEAISKFEPGELVRVVVTVKSDRNLRYVQIEDPVPSNCRVVERENLDIGDDWSFWWIALTIRDDRVAYFARNLDKGTFELEYTMRAEQAGQASALPASVFEMYEPASRAWTGINRLEVGR